MNRDANNVRLTARSPLDRGVIVNVNGLWMIGKGVGKLISAVLALVAQMERDRIRDLCEGGREAARASITLTGRRTEGRLRLAALRLTTRPR